ncbi:MAG: RNA polymerase sigma factor (sigma-70 family) [Planctomycetota bacterium]|jgi:RNA polymerase sigma factor (sigma-70 family)
MPCPQLYAMELPMLPLGFAFAVPKSNSCRRSMSPGPRIERVSLFSMIDPTPREDALLVRIARGDADAVNACLERYGSLVWSVVSKAWKDYSTIEDLVQEIFIDVWKSASRYDPEKASEATFIATIARRRVIDRRRRLGRSPEIAAIEGTDIPQEDTELARVDHGDEARLAHEALAELKPDQRRVIMMSVSDGLTHKEVATATGIPLGTVKSHIRRGLDEVAQKLRSAQGRVE